MYSKCLQTERKIKTTKAFQKILFEIACSLRITNTVFSHKKSRCKKVNVIRSRNYYIFTEQIHKVEFK